MTSSQSVVLSGVIETCDCASLVYDLYESEEICVATLPRPESIDFTDVANRLNQRETNTLFSVVRYIDSVWASKSQLAPKFYFTLEQFIEWQQRAKKIKIPFDSVKGGITSHNCKEAYQVFLDALSVTRGIDCKVGKSLPHYLAISGQTPMSASQTTAIAEWRLQTLMENSEIQSVREIAVLRKYLKKFPVAYKVIRSYQDRVWK